MRIDLGEDKDGGKRWAELIDLDDVPRRVKWRIQEDVLTLYEKAEMHPALIEMRTKDLLIANLVTEWSFGDPPNKDIEPVLDLPNSAYEALVEAVQPYNEDLDFMKASKPVRAAVEKALQPDELAGTSD
jgi:hypothetical protein